MLKRLFCFVTTCGLLALATVTGFGQMPDSIRIRIDSMVNLSLTNDSLIQLTNYNLSYDYFDIDNLEAARYALESYDISTARRDTLQMVRSGRLYGQLLRRLDKPREAVKVLTRSLELADDFGPTGEELRIINALAGAHVYLGNYDEALKLNLRCLEQREKEGNLKEVSISLNNLGLLHYKLSSYARALEYYERALEIRTTNGIRYNMGNLMTNIGLCYSSMGENDTAIEFARKALENPGEVERPTAGAAWFCLAGAYNSLGQYDSAVVYASIAYDFADVLNDNRLRAETAALLGAIHVKEGRPRLARQFLLEADEIAGEAGYAQIQENTYGYLAKYYASLGRFHESSTYLQKKIEIMDTLSGNNMMQRISAIQIENAEKANKLKIESQALLLAANEATMQGQQFVNLLSGAVSILMIGLALMGLRFARLQKSISKVLDGKVDERTRELRTNEHQLLKVISEQDAIMETIQRQIRSTMATMSGLAHLTELENGSSLDPVKRVEFVTQEIQLIALMVEKSRRPASEG